MKDSRVQSDAIVQKMFWTRNVRFVPAIRIAVMARIITKPNTKIQPLSDCTWVPQLISVWLSNTVPSVTSTGPSANTGKYRAQNVAPMMAEKAAPRFETKAAGGDRIRLTHT